MLPTPYGALLLSGKPLYLWVGGTLDWRWRKFLFNDGAGTYEYLSKCRAEICLGLYFSDNFLVGCNGFWCMGGIY